MGQAGIQVKPLAAAPTPAPMQPGPWGDGDADMEAALAASVEESQRQNRKLELDSRWEDVNGPVVLRQHSTLNQFNKFFSKAIARFNAPSSICGYLTIAHCRLLRQFLDGAKSPLPAWKLQEVGGKLITESSLVLKETERAMAGIAAKRQRYIDAHLREFSPPEARKYLRAWVANFEISDELREDGFPEGGFRSATAPSLHFARYNEFPQLGVATFEEKARIAAEQRRFGGHLNEKGETSTFEDGEFAHILERFEGTSSQLLTPAEWQALEPPNGLSVFAVDVNGHFVTAVAAWVVDGDGEEAKAVIQVFNTTDSSYLSWPMLSNLHGFVFRSAAGGGLYQFDLTTSSQRFWENFFMFKIFVLHSTIPMDEQEQVCHVFLASTIAESSVTLPKVRVVIDTCLRRQLCPDKSRHGVHCLLTQRWPKPTAYQSTQKRVPFPGREVGIARFSLSALWASRAPSKRQKHRPGRVFPGVSIRLVPRSFYTQHMTQYDAPEIEQANVLQGIMGIHLNESHSEDGSQIALMPYLQAGNFTGVRCAKQTRGVWQLWTMSAICSGLYTGLAPCGLRAPGGLAPSVPLGKPSLQSGTGLRMRSAYGDLVFERECAAGAPCVALPSAQLHRSLPELEAMSTAKLKNVARELQDKGGNCLPIAPGHREGLIAWILKAQDLAPSPAGAAAGIKSELGELADRGVALQQPAPLYVRAGSVPAERADRRRLRAEARLRAEGQKPWEG
ncbi:unnamed protein product [Effrenium voratum]|nr:unnamed protein product [Effrenium voratum]